MSVNIPKQQSFFVLCVSKGHQVFVSYQNYCRKQIRHYIRNVNNGCRENVVGTQIRVSLSMLQKRFMLINKISSILKWRSIDSSYDFQSYLIIKLILSSFKCYIKFNAFVYNLMNLKLLSNNNVYKGQFANLIGYTMQEFNLINVQQQIRVVHETMYKRRFKDR